MNGLRLGAKWSFNLLAGLVMIAAGGAFLSTYLLGLNFVIVLSGSMTPAMPVGSIIIVKPVEPDKVSVGDVITFWLPSDPEVLVTHRVTEFARLEDGSQAFKTKGDANEEADSYLVPAENVWGQALAAIPEIGNARDILRTPMGYFGLILIPGILLVGYELSSYRNDRDRRRQALKRRRRRRPAQIHLPAFR